MKAILAGALLLLPATANAQAPAIRIEAGGRTTVMEAQSLPGGLGYPATAFAAMGGRLVPFDEGLRTILFGDTLTFWTGSPFFAVHSTVVPLAAPTTATPAGLLVPAQFFTDWLPIAQADRIAYADGVLSVSGPVTFDDLASAPAAGPRVVIIDPGHGGGDTGKIGPNGLREKDAALQLSRRLAALLEADGYEVHLTRTTDTLIDLADRPKLANRWKAGRPAAIFVSIHFNSVAAPAARSARGFETFFLSSARTEDEQRVADLENAAVEFEDGPSEPLTDEMLILSGLRNDFYVRASNDLAESVQMGIASVQTSRNRGVKRAGFLVLVGALMPAVLIEAGFISNAQEANLIADSAFQDSIANAIAQSIAVFFDSHEHLWSGG